MARRARTRPTRQPATRRTVAWTEHFATLFSSVVPAEFEPPKRVSIVLGKASGTWSGLFTMPDGGQVRAYVRIAGIGSKAGPYLASKGMKFHFKVRGRQA